MIRYRKDFRREGVGPLLLVGLDPAVEPQTGYRHRIVPVGEVLLGQVYREEAHRSCRTDSDLAVVVAVAAGLRTDSAYRESVRTGHLRLRLRHMDPKEEPIAGAGPRMDSDPVVEHRTGFGPEEVVEHHRDFGPGEAPRKDSAASDSDRKPVAEEHQKD